MMLLKNARIFPMDKSFAPYSAMVWSKGKILELGPDSLAEKYLDAQQVDARGRTVLPGFIDPHIHFLQGVIYRNTLDCSPQQIPTLDQLKQRLVESARTKPKGHLSWPSQRIKY